MKIRNLLELIGRFELPTSSLPRVPSSVYAVPVCAISFYLVWISVKSYAFQNCAVLYSPI